MWRTVKLQDVCEKITDGSHFSPKTVDDGYAYITVRDINNDRINFNDCKYVAEDSFLELQRNGCAPTKGDVLFSKDGTVGKVALVSSNQKFVVLSSLAIISPKCEMISSEFLFYVMKSPSFVTEAIGRKTGVAIRRIILKNLKKIEFQLPSLAEQQRIVAKLDSAFAEIDRAIEATKSAADNLHKALVQHLHHCFSSIENDSYRYVGDVAEHCLGKMLDKKKNKGEPKPYLRNLNVRWFKVATDDLLEMKFESHEHERYSVRNGDLLICEGGYPGRAAIWNGDDEIYIQKAIHRVRFQNPNQNVWLMYYLFYLDVTDNLKQNFTGSGIQHFTGKALAKLPFPYLEDDIVTERLQTISMMQKHIEFASSIFERKVAALDSLKSAILAQELQPSEAA